MSMFSAIKPADERAVVLEQLDDYLKTIVKFKLREFVHLSPCFDAIPSIDVRRYPIDVRNYRRLLSLESSSGQCPGKEVGCPHRERMSVARRKVSRSLTA